MSTVIETGKTVEEALEKALVALGRSVDEVDYEVLEQPSRGFFGLFGGRMARLRVTEKQEDVTPAAPAAAASVSTTAAAGTPRARAEQFLRDIFRCMGLTVAMSARETDEGYVYDLSGESLGILIGKHGQTLDALQYLTNLAANRGCEAAPPRGPSRGEGVPHPRGGAPRADEPARAQDHPHGAAGQLSREHVQRRRRAVPLRRNRAEAPPPLRGAAR